MKSCFPDDPEQGGELLEKIKEFTDGQWDAYCEDANRIYSVVVISEEMGTEVVNPWMDTSARFDVADAEAVDEWGLPLVYAFCLKAAKELEQ